MQRMGTDSPPLSAASAVSASNLLRNAHRFSFAARQALGHCKRHRVRYRRYLSSYSRKIFMKA